MESRINVPEPPIIETRLEIILAKQENIRSQQTFLINIEVQDPSEPGIGVATPSDFGEDNDYSANTFLRRFEPVSQTLTIFVDIFPDSISEGPEGLQLSLSQVEMDSNVAVPDFSTPTVGSTLFPTTLVVIDDDDSEFAYDIVQCS